MGIINFITKAFVRSFNKMWMDPNDPIDAELIQYTENQLAMMDLNAEIRQLRKMTKPVKGMVVETYRDFKVLSEEEI